MSGGQKHIPGSYVRLYRPEPSYRIFKGGQNEFMKIYNVQNEVYQQRAGEASSEPVHTSIIREFVASGS